MLDKIFNCFPFFVLFILGLLFFSLPLAFLYHVLIHMIPFSAIAIGLWTIAVIATVYWLVFAIKEEINLPNF